MAAESAFSFHCMICVEVFDAADRFPVVLPCGHTYVCIYCANRLDKCMECRTPLSWNVPKPQQESIGSAGIHSHSAHSTSWSSARSGARSPGVTRQIAKSHPGPPQFDKRRLPLPKNVVLLSLLEATEMATEHAARRKPTATSPSDLPASASAEDEEEDSGEETEKIKAAFSVAAGTCGTYVVADKGGLQIYPSRPSQEIGQVDPSSKASQEDVDTLVRFFYLDQTLEGTAEEGNEESHGSLKDLPSAKLSCGDRVQIVSLDGSWAKLARGYGFVRAKNNGLVKIAGSVDKACKLEAMLRALSLRRKALSREQSKVDTHFVGLMSDLQTSLVNDEDLTVIPADTFGDAQEALESLGLTDNNNAAAAGVATANQGNFESESDSDDAGINYPPKPLEFRRSDSPPPVTTTLSGLCLPDSLFGALAQGPSSTNPSLPSSDAPDPPSPSALSAGARAWRERHGRQASQSIDFRTGMSGHYGVVSHHAHPHDYLRQARPLMSSYSGLTVARSGKRRVKQNPTTP